MSAEPKKEPVPPRKATAESDSEDDDDLDDLDDLLDEFSGPAKPKHTPATSNTSAEQPGATGGLDPDFAKTLEMGMADLLKELNDTPELKAEFDKLVKELNDATLSQPSAAGSPNPPPASSSATPGAGAAGPSSPKAKSFADTINQTMNRMESSSEQVTSSLTEEETDDFLAEMLKQMQSTLGSGTGNSDEDLSKMLLGIMEQLTNKEILYEPMKELHQKFPDWLEKNAAAQKEEDLKRYREQSRLVKEIVERFERPGYSDDNTEDREYIVDRMQQMQASGTPPQDLMDSMSEGGIDGLPDLDACGIQ